MERYGIWFPDTWSDFDIERSCFLQNKGPLVEAPDALGPAGHARNCIDLLWNYEGSPQPFVWTPWAEAMLDAVCRKRDYPNQEFAARYQALEAADKGDTVKPEETRAAWECLFREQYIGLAGQGSSGKTAFCAVWGIFNYLCAPLDTKIFCTSTSLKEAHNRIWGQVIRFWGAVRGIEQYGKPVESLGLIKGVNEKGTWVRDRGLELVAGEQKKEKEAIKKLKGFKAPRIIFLADELGDLSPALVEAAKANLSLNKLFQFIGSANPDKFGDPFGLLCEPKNGWSSISADSDEWESILGYVLHFDGFKNPNILNNKDIYPFLMTVQEFKQKKQDLGENSAMFWQQVRGYWSPTGKDDAIYSEPELMKAGVGQIIVWLGEHTMIAFMDPDFTPDGDGCAFLHAAIGPDKEGKQMFNHEGAEYFREQKNDPNPRSYQIVDRARKRCADLGIRDEHFGFDGSAGSGQTFGDVVDMMWNGTAFKLSFGGSASTRQIMRSGQSMPANEAYYNKVTELWFGLKEFLFSAQIAGIKPSHRVWKELTTRLYEQKGSKTMVQAEPKVDMRGRIGYSPNEADALVGLIELARQRLGFAPTGVKSVGRETRRSTWDDFVRKNDVGSQTLTPPLVGFQGWG